MPLNKKLKKVMIIGSGPIIIGQAAEFDYSGTQACKAIREEGIETVLVNSNPATIMTDANMADKVYIEPLVVDSIEKIIAREKPDGLLAGFGGQTALNLAIELDDKGILKKYKVQLLGMKLDTIKKAEDREEFKNLMVEIDEPVAKSIIATNLKQCEEFVGENGYPVIIRPAYTMGGTGGGIAENKDQLIEICTSGIEQSPISQILLEQSVAGWKEIEFEVIRDSKGSSMIICGMENMDPVGVHTGDSIVVAPCQTLASEEYYMLRTSALKLIDRLGIEGGCNVQYALDPNSKDYIAIEVNPRVSRSSALASKATGYPIAKIAAKIAIGYNLDELKNYLTGSSSAFTEPTIDYIVAKIPKWPFDKFLKGARRLGTQMKATGEVMSIGRSFESAILKALDSLEGKFIGVFMENIAKLSKEDLIEKIKMCDDERIFAISQGLRVGMTIDELHDLTMIDKFFLNGIKNIVNLENEMKIDTLNPTLLRRAKKMGFTDQEISELTNIDLEKIVKIEGENNIERVYKMVDTCAGEFDAQTPYYYSCHEDEDENEISDKEKIIVLGSGPIRIGQGIEFDYCCVHGLWAINEAGYESIVINNNPETVSTDFDIADKLYFESLYIDNVMEIIKKEKPKGVVVQFGGQTAINLAEKLDKLGVNILGTSFDSIDLAEDRGKFGDLLESLDIKAPKGTAVSNLDEGLKVAHKLEYPVIVRPSYVIGGRAMQVVYDDESLKRYMKEAVDLSKEHMVLVDKYVSGTEIEVDAICDGEEVLLPGIMEHIERTGVHSGDSITVYPPITLDKEVIDELVESTTKIAKKLKTVGLINIQYVYDGKDIYVIEVNPRASRTVPILSKITGVPMVNLAVEAMLGKKLKDLGYGSGIRENKNMFAVKVPVFSTEKLVDVDIYLGPEMKSTGEVLGVDSNFNHAVYKGFKASGVKIPSSGGIYVSFKEIDKKEGKQLVEEYLELGFKLYASLGTAKYLNEEGIDCTSIKLTKIEEKIKEKKIDIIINTPTKGNDKVRRGFRLRRKATEHRVPIFTSIDTAKLFLTAIDINKKSDRVEYKTMNEYFGK